MVQVQQHPEGVSVDVLLTARQRGSEAASETTRTQETRTHLENDVSRKPSNTTEQKSSEPNSSDSRVRCPDSRCRKMSPKAMSL